MDNELKHYGVKGMKWGVRNEETLAKYASKGLYELLGGEGGSVEEEKKEKTYKDVYSYEDTLYIDRADNHARYQPNKEKVYDEFGKEHWQTPATLETYGMWDRKGRWHTNRGLTAKKRRERVSNGEYILDVYRTQPALGPDGKPISHSMQSEDNSLAHYGVLGMKWGVRHDPRQAYLKAMKTIQKREDQKAAKVKKADYTVFGRSRDKKIAKYNHKAAKAEYRLNKKKARGRIRSIDKQMKAESTIAKWKYRSTKQSLRKAKYLNKLEKLDRKNKRFANAMNKEFSSVALKDIGYKSLASVPARERELGRKYVIDLIYS